MAIRSSVQFCIALTLGGLTTAAWVTAAEPAPMERVQFENQIESSESPQEERKRYQKWLGNLGIYGDAEKPARTTTAPASDDPPRKGTSIHRPKLPRSNDQTALDAFPDNTPNLWRVSGSQVGGDFSVDVHPDGRQIVFSSTQHSRMADLYVKQVDGHSIRQLTQSPSNEVMPAISPDGTKVAFASDRNGNWDIFVKRLDGSGPVEQITRHPTHELHPSWSPDGQKLVFSNLAERSGRWEIVLVHATHTARRTILGPGLFPRFNPNPATPRIVYQKTRKRGSRTFSIWTMDLHNDQALRPTEIAAATNAALINPDWSPSGRRIVFASIVNPSAEPDAEPDRSDLWIIHANGSGLRALTQDFYTNLQPAWGPNQTVFFVSNRSGHENIWAIRTGLSAGPEPKEKKPK